MKDKEVFNPQTRKYRYTNSEGNTKEIGFEDLCVKKDDRFELTFSDKVEHGRLIIIDTDSITFRAGEFELKVTNDRLMQELNHTDKIIINGLSYIKEE